MPRTNSASGDAVQSGLDSVSGGGAKVRVEQAAIPTMRKAFQRALDKLTPQIGHARTDLRMRPWAGDPVSDEAAEKFNERSMDGGEAALSALEGYQQQLQTAVRALQEVEYEYRGAERGNADSVRVSGC
ncbi:MULTISPECIES: transcriptional regulator [unclassified Crossiella]|uniref:transcriptional regulator n=1 Tax=unclassified Crossiella TaxID=2620835 RepID=UPI00207CEE4A|nr:MULTISPECIES: transcriptional regulator [unclassified Crossiella]MCO1581076.1 transcriptional regulator [Crossiella sp. SN42]WHT20314.1 transcriptional regulator [Crossiella sp. CA-258035]